jgi:potassium/chloride transporter 4/5/6
VAAHEKAVISLKLGNQQPFPMCNERLSGTVDVWWLLHDGGILVLISHLLHRHAGTRSTREKGRSTSRGRSHSWCAMAVWRNCRLRLFTVVEGAENEGRVTADLANYLQVRHKKLSRRPKCRDALLEMSI